MYISEMHTFAERYKCGHNDTKLEAIQMFNSRIDKFWYTHTMEIMRIYKSENEYIIAGHNYMEESHKTILNKRI